MLTLLLNPTALQKWGHQQNPATAHKNRWGERWSKMELLLRFYTLQ